LIGLAHRREDRSAAVQNFVAVARRVVLAAKHIEKAKVPQH
jgi:hypothetical protein